MQIEKKLAVAEERRKAAEEEKVKTVLERSGLERHGRMKSASAYERQKQYSATVAKRQQQLKEIRDRLKDKHRKNDMARLNITHMVLSGVYVRMCVCEYVCVRACMRAHVCAYARLFVYV